MEEKELYELLQRCNRTELYQRVRGAGKDAHPYSTKEELIETLLNDAPGRNNPVDPWREAQMTFVLDHWEVLRPQIAGCPASTRDPKACFRCHDMQVITCLAIENEDNVEEIEQYVFASRKD